MKRIGYAIATVILLLIEVLIAMYVHDAFVRPYIGDVLVVVVIYTFIRIFVLERCELLPLCVFMLAACSGYTSTGARRYSEPNPYSPQTMRHCAP